MDAANLVFMGTSVIEGTATAVAFATGAGTQFGQIYQLTAQVVEVASPLQLNVNRMAKQVSAMAVALAALVFGLRAATTAAGLVDNFVFALGVGFLSPNSLSCPSPGNCAAGGNYPAASGHFQAFAVVRIARQLRRRRIV